MIQFLKKLWKMWENIGILNLSQQKEEKTIWCQKPNYQTAKFFTENLLAIENEKNGKIHE